jgi:anthranilate phosphoribosyltransferase
MWMPEPQRGTREDRLRVRRRLQVRSWLHLQALLSNNNRAAYCALGLVQPPGTGPVRGVTSKPERTLQCHSTNGALDDTLFRATRPRSRLRKRYTQFRRRELDGA